MADFLDNNRLLGIADGGNKFAPFIFVRRQNLDLDKLVIIQGSTNFMHHTFTEAIAGYGDNGSQVMTDGAKPLFIFLAYHRVFIKFCWKCFYLSAELFLAKLVLWQSLFCGRNLQTDRKNTLPAALLQALGSQINERQARK